MVLELSFLHMSSLGRTMKVELDSVRTPENYHSNKLLPSSSDTLRM